MQSLADCIERAALGGEKEVGARGVAELKVLRVASLALSSKANRCGSILAFAISLARILLLVNFGHHMIAQPGVHYEVAAAVLLDEPDDCVRVGHLGSVAETDSGPLVSSLCLDNELN